jgi:D-glycero-D-manno-heptose 1,7-bisphosphate phosphatase
MSNNSLRKAIFLDRDGVINHDPGDYTTKLSEFIILPGVVEALQQFTKSGYFIIVITNQGGIAKDIYTLDDFYEIDTYMSDTFLAAGIAYLETYFCPHHDAISQCLCRKPHSGMIEKAIAVHNINPEDSFMIGDKFRDIEAAEAAGVRGVKIDVNQDLRTVRLASN